MAIIHFQHDKFELPHKQYVCEHANHAVHYSLSQAQIQQSRLLTSSNNWTKLQLRTLLAASDHR
jgi:hypothetical protein